MKIKRLEHASFLITADNGTKILTDPYKTDGRFRYGEIKETADIVTVSHAHGDHSNVEAVQGKPTVLREPGEFEVKGIKFKGFPAYHDNAGGKNSGSNVIFRFVVDGVRVCHLGDLGHPLSGSQVADIGQVDVLLAPVGGVSAIDAKIATDIMVQLGAKVIMPMHFKTDRCDLAIAGVGEFLKKKPRVRQPDTSEVEFKQDAFPTYSEVFVLKPAL